MTKKELALSLHDKKYNCAQSVACAFADDLGVDSQTLFKICEGFGLGMGCMDGTCGAISGAIAVISFKNSDGNLSNPASKASTYQLSKQVHQKFAEKNCATICRVLKGVDTGNVLRSCNGCIEDAEEIVKEILNL